MRKYDSAGKRVHPYALGGMTPLGIIGGLVAGVVVDILTNDDNDDLSKGKEVANEPSETEGFEGVFGKIVKAMFLPVVGFVAVINVVSWVSDLASYVSSLF